MRFLLKLSLHRLLVASVAVLGSYSPAVSGDPFGEFWGVVTDPLKLRASSNELSASIERALIQLNQLEGNANAHVRERLAQIHLIAQDVIERGRSAVDDALKRMDELEKAINRDALELTAKMHEVARF
jgi:hypothetical protein